MLDCASPFCSGDRKKLQQHRRRRQEEWPLDNNPSVPSSISISISPEDDEVVKKNSKNISGTTKKKIAKKQQQKQQHGYQNQVSNNNNTNQDQSSACFSPKSITGRPVILQQCHHNSPQSYTGDNNGKRGGGREDYAPAPPGVDTTCSTMTSSPDHNTCRRIRFPPPPYRPSSSGESHLTTKSIASVYRASSLPPPPPRPPPTRPSSHQRQQHLTSPPPPPVSCYTPCSSHRFCSPKEDDTPTSSSSTMKEIQGRSGGHDSPIESDNNINGIAFSDSCQSLTDEQQYSMKLPSLNKSSKKTKEKKKKNEKSVDQSEKTAILNTTRSYYSNSGSKNHYIIRTQTMQHCISTPTSQQQKDTLTSKHTFAGSDGDLLKRVSIVCESIYSYLNEFDSRNKNILPTSAVNDNYGNDKYSPSFFTPENNRYRRRHTTDNITIKQAFSSSSSSNVDNVKNKMKEHNDLSFNPGRNNSSYPLVYSRRHSTSSPYSRCHSTSGAKMSLMSPITTEQTSRMTVATTSQGGGSATTTTAAAIPKSNNKDSINSGSSYRRNVHSLMADPSTPSSQDFTSSLQSVVHVQKQVSRMQSSSSSSTMIAEPTSLQHQPKQPPLQQRRRHYLRSLSMDDSNIMMRRGEGGQINECLSSKAVIDNLADQFSNTRRCRSTSSRRNLSSGNCAQLNSLLKTQALLQQLRTSLEDDAVARNGIPLRNKEHMAHKLLPPPSTPVTFWPEEGRVFL